MGVVPRLSRRLQPSVYGARSWARGTSFAYSASTSDILIWRSQGCCSGARGHIPIAGSIDSEAENRTLVSFLHLGRCVESLQPEAVHRKRPDWISFDDLGLGVQHQVPQKRNVQERIIKVDESDPELIGLSVGINETNEITAYSV
jgi:hypothetical protein